MAKTENHDQILVKQQLDLCAREQQLVLDNVPNLVASFTSDHHYVWVNRSYLNFFGLKHQDEIRGKHVREIMGNEGWEHVQPYMNRALAGERVVFDVEISSVTGFRDLEANYIPKFNEQGQVLGFYALITDVHDRKLIEKGLQRSEEKFRTIFEQSTIGVALIESKTDKLLQVNQRYCEITGLATEQLQGTTIQSITHPDDLQITLDVLNDLHVHKIQTFSIETRYVKPDSTFVWVNLTVSSMAYIDAETPANLIAVVEDISELKADQNAVVELAAIVESSKDAIMSKSLDGVITSWNQSAKRLFGYTAEEAIGQPKAMLLPEDRLNEVRENITRIKRGEIVENFETVRRCKDGSLIDVALSVSPLRGPNEQLIGAATIARDITERKQIEAKLAESEAWFSGILDIADDAVIAVDEASIIQLFNKGAEHTFGYRAEELIGQSLNKLLPIRFSRNHQSHIQKFAQTPVVSRQMGERSEIYGLRKDGTEFPAEASISRLNTSKGMTFTVILRDITERIEAQKAASRLAAIVESSDDAIMGKSLDGTITSWNKSAEHLFGYAAEEAIGQPKAMLLPADRPNEVRENIARLRNGEIVDHFETIRKCKDGSLIEVALSVSPVHDLSGKLIGAASIARDISERKQIQHDLAESEAWFSGILNIADDAVIAVDESSVIQLFNKGAERIFGYNSDEIIGQSLNILLPKRFTHNHQAHIRGFAQTPIVSRQMGDRSEIYGLRKNGKEFPAEASISKLDTSKGKTFTVILRDITERKRIENDLAESEAWFSGILNIADDAVIAVDESSVIQLFNKGAEQIFGYSSEDIMGQSLNTLMPKRFTHNHQTHIRGFAQTSVESRKMGERREIYGLRKDGTEFPAEASISKLNTSKGLTFTVILRDITERKETEKAIARLAAIVESSEDAIMAKSLDGIITSWNKSAEHLFGYTTEEAVGQPKSMLLPSDRPSEVKDILARIQNGEVIQNYETIRCHKDGTLVDVALSVSPVRNTRGKLIGAATIARDITERKRSAQLLTESNDRLRKLSRQVEQTKETEQKRIAQELHDEFGQSLSSLKWDLAYLKIIIHRNCNIRDFDDINARIDDMSNLLVDAIQATRRIATSLRPPMLDDLGLVPALEWQIDDFQERTGIPCLFSVSSNLSPELISVDQATALFRITQELLTNVLRHARASKIKINLERRDNLLCLELQDDGVGYRDPLGEPRSSLGLLGIQERAEMLQGSFTIQGVPGQGTTAIVIMPLMERSNESK